MKKNKKPTRIDMIEYLSIETTGDKRINLLDEVLGRRNLFIMLGENLWVMSDKEIEKLYNKYKKQQKGEK